MAAWENLTRLFAVLGDKDGGIVEGLVRRARQIQPESQSRYIERMLTNRLGLPPAAFQV